MFLEYTVDSNEEEIFPSSIELRKRFAARRTQTAIDCGLIDEKKLAIIRDKNKEELKHHGSDVLDITIAEVGTKVTLMRIDQQLKIESGLRVLERDIGRASRLGKTRLDTLNDLERRILLMRQELKVPGVRTVQEELEYDKKINNKLQLESMFSECKICKRRILVQLLKAHTNACEKLGGKPNNLEPIYNPEKDLATSIATFLPQPPRNCTYARKGCTFIEFEWEPPVLDGGLAVFDYEVKYQAYRIEFDAKAAKEGGSKWKRWTEYYGPVKTSLWCMKDIVSHKGAKIVNLWAATDYSDFEIRCCNIRGWSDWTRMHGREVIRTDEPDQPSIPLFFEVENVTSSCIHLRWSKPMYTGGAEVNNYIIHYTIVERHISASSRELMVPRELKVSVGAAEMFILRNLPSDTDVVNIYITAENSAGLISEPNKRLFAGAGSDYAAAPVVRTAGASRHKQLMEQLKIAKDSKDNFIDTDFIGNIQQRINRMEYINYLSVELKKEKPHWLEEEEGLIWANIKVALKKKETAEAERLEAIRRAEDEDFSSDEEDDDGAKKFIFPFRARRAHFRHKISSLEALLVALGQEKHEIDSRRSRLTNVMKQQQKRKLELQLEKDRIKNFRGDVISSSVLHGTSMRYNINEFVVKVQREYETSLGLIADSKLAVINGENRKLKVKKETEEAAEFLQDRTAAFKSFSLEHEKAVKAMEKMQTSDIQIYKFFFDKLKTYVTSLKQSKMTVERLFNRVRVGALRQAFIKWKTGDHEKSSDKHAGFDGVGSILLQKVKETRLEIQGLARAAISEIPHMLQKVEMVRLAKDQRKRLVNSVEFAGMEEGLDHVGLEKRGMHYLYEADGLMLGNKFELAKNLYEHQIWSLRAQRPTNIKWLAICYGRLGKLFLRQERFDRAIVEFDRQLSLANEIDDNVESADAYYGIGTGFLGRSNFDDAIRYLDIAQARLAAIGSSAKYCGALRGLRECYERINKPNIAKIFAEKIEMDEGELHMKIDKIGKAYQSMKGRLVKTSADIEFMVTMERCGKRVLDLRKLLRSLHEEHDVAEKDASLHEEKIKMQVAMLIGIESEIEECMITDEPFMESRYCSDVPQVIEIEELRRRIPLRRDEEAKKLANLQKETLQIETRMKNAIDCIQIEDENLEVEEGVLARHTRHDKPFRVVAFSPSNAAGNEVSGTATGGVETFACGEGHNVHLIDYHSGELTHIFIGDDKGSIGEKCGHTGVVTCIFYDGPANRVYSGSVDETIILWDTVELKKLNVLVGHEGTIVCISVDGHLLVSGSSDNTVRIWDKDKCVSLRVIHGHSRSVLCVDFGSTWLVTGSADEEIRVWDIQRKSQHTLKAQTKFRLVGHEAPVTCVKYGKLEIVSSDNLGRIFVWWADTGAVLRQCSVHTGSVKSIQFDAIHIVSGGVDNNVCITDIATGEVLQTLRGHTGTVLSIAFDTERIVSAGGDNTLRYWQWGGKSGPSDKLHVLDTGETLMQVAKKYALVMTDLMKWNGITEMKQCFPGMKLVVQKGNPSEPTDAEAKAIDKERRRIEAQSFSERRLKNAKLGQSNKYDRVHRLAMDLDSHSLGNRMYGEDKKARDLFQDSIDINKDNYSLASRLHPVDQSHLDAKASRFFFSEANENEWGLISDLLARSMLDMLVEYETYDLVKEQKRMLRNTESVVGRIHKYEVDGFVVQDPAEWQAQNAGKRMPLKIRRHFERVVAAEEQRKLEAAQKAERDRMRLVSRERQGAGLPNEPILSIIRREHAIEEEKGDDYLDSPSKPPSLQTFQTTSLISMRDISRDVVLLDD